MNLFKKATATLALVTLVSGIFSTGVSASSSTEIEAANALAEAGYIVNHSSAPEAYNLNQNVLRQEIAAVARGIAGLEKKTTCQGSFTDVSATTPNTWACYTVEALLDAGLIAANTRFNPEMNISKAEAVGMMVKAAFDDEYAYDSSLSTTWQEQVVEFAAAKGIVASFTNYDTPATRGFVFEVGYNAMVASDEVVDDCDEVSQLLGLCDEDTDDTDTDNGTGPVVSGDNVLTAELSAETPEGTALPRNANGVDVLAFDVTAGSEDVSITSIEFERTGFGEAAVKEIAVYTEIGRASKLRSFSTSDDTANVAFSPAVIVKAGETRTLTVKANTSTTVGEFAVSVKGITASSTVDSSDIVSNYFDVKAVDAAKLNFIKQSVNNRIKAGEQQADVMKFRLTNEGIPASSTDANITVSSVTLKEIGNVDQETELENITLTVDNKVVDTVKFMTDRYVTFNFDPIVIGDDKNKTFTVKADIIGGAGKTVQFQLESPIDITASSSKYNAVNIVPTDVTGTEVNIDAGELTIYSIDATSDKIRSDKKNVVLGQLRVVNIAGKNLELKNLGINLETTNSGVLQVLENVEFEFNGTSYDLLATSNTGSSILFRETGLDVILPQGTSILTIRADTLKGLTEGTTVKMTLNVDSPSTKFANFRVEETNNDVVVDDLTPGNLSWDILTVKDSAATISNVPLAHVSVVKGATDLVALQFDIDAGTASSLSVDEIKVKLTSSTGGALATKDQISQVALYKGSVSESNILKRVSGSRLADGYATFDGFLGGNVKIAADATQTFVVTVSLVDIFTTGTVISAVIANPQTDVSLEDDENDTILLAPGSVGAKTITVLDSGKLRLTADSNNTDNENPKTILAGEEAIVYSVDAIATNEAVKVDTVKFTLTGATLKDVISSAKLYLDGNVVATASNAKVTDGTNTSQIVFDNISNLRIGTTPGELKLAIVTENIGNEKIGKSVSNIRVSDVIIEDAKGANSSEKLVLNDNLFLPTTGITGSNTFAVVPATVIASIVQKLESGSVKVRITVNTGNNTDSNNSSAPTVIIQGLGIKDLVTGTDLANFNIYEEGKSATLTEGSFGVPVSGSKTFELVPTITTNKTYTLRLPKDGIKYDAGASTGLTSNLSSELDLGTKTYPN